MAIFCTGCGCQHVFLAKISPNYECCSGLECHRMTGLTLKDLLNVILLQCENPQGYKSTWQEPERRRKTVVRSEPSFPQHVLRFRLCHPARTERSEMYVRKGPSVGFVGFSKPVDARYLCNCRSGGPATSLLIFIEFYQRSPGRIALGFCRQHEHCRKRISIFRFSQRI